MSAGASEWLARRPNPLLARLAFGSGSTLGLSQFDEETYELDLNDPGQRMLGEYELLECIGQGGMGMVYRARQLRLQREVALKLLSAGPWASDAFVARFQQEAQHAARLQHPNIVTVYEIGEHRGLIYYAMELIDGVSLDVMLQQAGPLPPRTAALLLRSVAEAVDYAHRLDVLHLDLKPGNVLMSADGTPKIADFGLARRLERSDGPLDNEHISGTPDYMAPEQAEVGVGKLGRATDVWGLGAVFYEMLTGQPPFHGEHAAEVIEKVRTEPVVLPSRLHPDLPADLEAICLHCLRKDPAQRYPNARALADDLTRFIEGRAVSVRPLGTAQRMWRWAKREPRLATAASAVVVALITGIVATSLQWRRAEHNAQRVSQESTRVREALWRQRRDAAWQFFADGEGFSALPLLTANLREAEAAGALDDIRIERLRIGLLRDASPRLIDVIALGARIDAVALSRDGRLVAAGTNTGEIRMFDTATGRERWRTDTSEFPKMLNDIDGIGALSFSPDGRYLVATARWPSPVINPSGQSMMLIDVASGRLVMPPAGFANFADATFSADGRMALLRGSDATARMYLTEGWRPLGPLVRRDFATAAWLMADDGSQLVNWLTLGDQARLDLLQAPSLSLRRRFTATGSAWAFSPDGRWLALGQADGHVRVIDTRNGREQALSPQPSARVVWLSFSDDSAWLVALAAGGGEIHAWDVADGSALMPPIQRRLTSWARIDRSTGLLAARVDNRLQLYQLSPSRGAALPLGPAMVSPGLLFGYSADIDFARGLIATGGAEGELRLWRIAGSAQLLPAQAAALAPADAPFDGRHVPFVDEQGAGVLTIGQARPASLKHAQPVYLAELDREAKTLITLSGREARAWDWRARRLRWPAVQLPETPQRVAIDPSGSRVALTFARPTREGFIEELRVLDLRSGAFSPARRELHGPLKGLRFGTDGAHLAAWGGDPAEPVVLDAASLSPTSPPLHAPYPDADVRDVVVHADRVDAIVAANRDHPEGNALLRWHARTGRMIQRVAFVGEPLGLASTPDGSRLAIGGPARTVLDGQGRLSGRLPPEPDRSSTVLAAALSDDGRIVAFALRDGVQLADARTGQPLAPLMTVPLGEPDAISTLTFAGDGSGLLARTWLGRWLMWPLREDTRSSDAIDREARLLGGGERDYGAPLSPPLDARMRAQLREGDPGIGRILPPLAAHAPAIPTRDAALPATMLDLTPFYTSGLTSPTLMLDDGIDLSRLPPGPQRLLGVDYDVRGMIGLTMAVLEPSWGGSGHTRMPGIPVDQRADALYVLGTSGTQSQKRQPVALGRVVLHYEDGSHAELPLIWSRDFVAFWESPRRFPQPRVAWAMPSQQGWGSDDTLLFQMRLANPHPDRVIRTLDLQSTDEYWSAPIFVAITLQPPQAVAAQ